ncbi:MAG: TM0106 family RecB-like putative nuclease [Phycisphaerae bacterium]|nr:TM0106 family RecB-like putative nuclease [Phycisphaerae bacterium]
MRKHIGVRFPRKNSPFCTISVDDLAATCDALLKPKRESAKSHTRLEPHVVVGTHGVTDDQKLRLAFAGYVVGQTTRYRPSIGLIVPLTESPKQIRLEPLYSKVRPIINDLRELITKPASEPPPLCLNKHCQLCQFCDHCTKEAEQNDSLSLLERITPKLIRKYQKKGIFTITQLSYLYKPRRRKKKTTSSPLLFKVELQALAIRTNKIYLHEAPTLLKQPIELFLDVEGIPHQGFDYLIGLVARNGNDVSSHSFWADSLEEEAKIFAACLQKAAEYGDAPIYHYGSYEPRAFQRASKKHGIDCGALTNRMVNVNSFVFGKVYFPTRSNRLKDLGACVGASWSAPEPSGLQSLVWRHRWEETGKKKFKNLLLSYNREDCHAVRLLTVDLQNITEAAASRSDVDFADRPKENCTELGQEIHRIFDNILNSAHFEYRNRRIIFQSKDENSISEPKKRGAQEGHKAHLRAPPVKAAKTVHVRRLTKCPRHKGQPLDPTDTLSEHIAIDLVFTRSGCRKTTVKYSGKRAYCPICHYDHAPSRIRKLGGRLFSHKFQAWAAYQRVALRLPYRVISQVTEELFSEHISKGVIIKFMRYLAGYYSHTETLLLRLILTSPFIHADETKISIRGKQHYVWVLTNGTHVAFQLTETRETTLLQQTLHDYEGVLISDFYPGYDSFPCRQQKCLSHLIGDLNDDLWKNPFDLQYESFLAAVRDLLVSIFKDIERYGLKTRFLKKHMKAVDRFYKLNIDDVQHKCEIVQKYQKRFARYRESLFRFLIEDGIPWNNNTAERALRHLAIQRKISGSFSKRGATDYLKLLGIAQTCRFQEKSFLKFLLSEERDVDKYKERKRRVTKPGHS